MYTESATLCRLTDQGHWSSKPAVEVRFLSERPPSARKPCGSPQEIIDTTNLIPLGLTATTLVSDTRNGGSNPSVGTKWSLT